MIDLQEPVLRDGLPIQKGIVLTSTFLDDHAELIQKWLNFWLLYPDLYLDCIKPADSPINLFFYQRIALRASIRYRYHSLTATRATSKSFIALLSLILRAIFMPGSKLFTCADVKSSAIKITKSKLDEIFAWWPLLKNEVKTMKASTDYIEIIFKNGSVFTIVSMTSAGRGTRSTGGVVEESATIDGIALQEIIIPMMNIDRRDALGRIVPGETNQHQSYITTAGSKSCFMYSKLIEMLVMECLQPEEYFVWGMDFRVPVFHGLISKKFLDEQRFSSTFSEESFARESMSIWTGQSAQSWFNSKQLNRHRKLLKCEREANKNLPPKAFYLISCDVGRYRANSAIIVTKVLPKEEAPWQKKVVYIETIHNTSLIDQATRIKKISEDFHPREIVIDGNGVGAGLIDAMVRPSYDEETGINYSPFYVFNDKNYPCPGYAKDKVPGAPIPEKNILIYNLKAGAGNDSEIHGNCYAQINAGNVDFLAPERIVKTKLLSTIKGQKMTLYDRRKYLLPYEMTSRLIDEMNNLQVKPTGEMNGIKVEQINKATLKDRFSSLEYNLWRIKFYEDQTVLKAKKKNFKLSDCIKFTAKKGVR